MFCRSCAEVAVNGHDHRERVELWMKYQHGEPNEKWIIDILSRDGKWMSEQMKQIILMAVDFHGFPAPGVVEGAIMADYGLDLLGQVNRLGVVVETWICFPSGVEIAVRSRHRRVHFRIVDYGKCAASFYDRESRHGVRVTIDHRKLRGYGKIEAWLLRKGKKEGPKEHRYKHIIEEIIRAGRKILSYQHILVKPTIDCKDSSLIKFCNRCGEPFPFDGHKICKACRKDSYYYNTTGLKDLLNKSG